MRSGPAASAPRIRAEYEQAHDQCHSAPEDDSVHVNSWLPGDFLPTEDVDALRASVREPATAAASAAALPGGLTLAGAASRGTAETSDGHDHYTVPLDRLAKDTAHGQRVSGLLQSLLRVHRSPPGQ